MSAMMLKKCRYFRIHSSENAYLTGLPRGLFTVVGKLVDSKTLNEGEIEEYWKNRHWFEAHLPVPPFYEDGNTIRAVTWYKYNDPALDMFVKMSFYFAMARKYGLTLLLTRTDIIPGHIIYEDEYQVGVVDSGHQGPDFETEVYLYKPGTS